jgi:hypothetical protein
LDFKIGSDERKAPLLSADENIGQNWQRMPFFDDAAYGLQWLEQGVAFYLK